MATMTTTSSSTAKQPSRTFSIRRSIYGIAKIPVERPKTAGGKKSSGQDDEAHRNRLKRRTSSPAPVVSYAPTSLGKSPSEACIEPGWRVSLAPSNGPPPPVPDLQVSRSAPPGVQTSKITGGTSTRVLADNKDSGNGDGVVVGGNLSHPHINVKPPEQPNHPSTSNTTRQQLHLITQIPEVVASAPIEPKSRSFSFVERARRSFLAASPSTPTRSTSPSPRSSKEEDGALSVNSAASTPTTSTPTRPAFPTSSESSPDRSKPHFDRIASDSRLDGLPKKSQKTFSRMFQLRGNLSSPDLRTVGPSARGQATVETGPARKQKDELHDAFRALENDFQRFQQSRMDKTIIIRQYLLPFLERHAGKNPKDVAPEELEKRVRTLHKWWIGLLGQMRIRNSHFMSGTERPFYMDAISAIMTRPEWRTAPSSFAPLSAKQSVSPQCASSDSLSSASSGFSIQTAVQHNIKSLYSTAIYDTMAFVIDKMGYRGVSPAVVAFGGKVLAYAFFFCNGVPEMLVHLWDLQPALVRRVLPEFGIGRGTDLRDTSDLIVGEFPETLHCLGFCSFVTMLRLLRQTPKTPLGDAEIDWHGPWIGRWRGRDSDLVYIFFKHYHILMYDYLPSSASAIARICAPGYLPVLAQMSHLIETTLCKQTPVPPVDTTRTTFEDLLNASAPLPLTTKNVTAGRPMAENQHVILLQDILINSDCVPSCRDDYAAAFMTLLKARVRRTRRYDSGECFQLCELLEEVLPIMSQAVQTGREDHADWDFWFDTMKAMMESENNMTELRVISFVHTIWNILVESDERKWKWCLEWLLSPPIWERFFYHWCPMVRAYYMRMVCWRISRYLGGESQIDREILQRLHGLLSIGFKHHMRLLEKGKMSSTAPCLPAPNRRLVIVKNDPPVSPQGVLLDGIIPNSGPRAKSMGASPFSAGFDQKNLSKTLEEESSPAAIVGKRWSQLRNVFGFKTPSPTESPPRTPNRLSSSSISSTTSEDPPAAPPPLSFKFSLEWIERHMLGIQRELEPVRLPRAALAFLETLPEDMRDDDSIPLRIPTKYGTYIGRALAEWCVVVEEHDHFLFRRKSEGRPTDNDVETPSLGVEPGRKF